jgi:hypothetical protein
LRWTPPKSQDGRLNETIGFDVLGKLKKRDLRCWGRRMGEAVRDNLGMNRTLEQAAFIGMRSFTWTVLGPFKEILGGYKALAQGLMNGEIPISMKSDAYDPRIGYAIMFPMTVAMIGSTLNYLMTAQLLLRMVEVTDEVFMIAGDAHPLFNFPSAADARH